MIPRKVKKCVCCGKPGFIWSHGHLRDCWLKKNGKPIPKRSKKRIENHGTGEYDEFVQIANERPHVCFVTRRAVNVWMWYEDDEGVWQKKLDVRCFIHVVAKGPRTDLRLLKENIVIGEPWVHDVYDKGTHYDVTTSTTYTVKDAEKYEGWHKLMALHDEIIAKHAQDKTVRA